MARPVLKAGTAIRPCALAFACSSAPSLLTPSLLRSAPAPAARLRRVRVQRRCGRTHRWPRRRPPTDRARPESPTSGPPRSDSAAHGVRRIDARRSGPGQRHPRRRTSCCIRPDARQQERLLGRPPHAHRPQRRRVLVRHPQLALRRLRVRHGAAEAGRGRGDAEAGPTSQAQRARLGRRHRPQRVARGHPGLRRSGPDGGAVRSHASPRTTPPGPARPSAASSATASPRSRLLGGSTSS